MIESRVKLRERHRADVGKRGAGQIDSSLSRPYAAAKRRGALDRLVKVSLCAKKQTSATCKLCCRPLVITLRRSHGGGQ